MGSMWKTPKFCLHRFSLIHFQPPAYAGSLELDRIKTDCDQPIKATQNVKKVLQDDKCVFIVGGFRHRFNCLVKSMLKVICISTFFC